MYDILVRHSKVISKGKHDLGEMRNVKHTIEREGSPFISNIRKKDLESILEGGCRNCGLCSN